LRAEIGYALGEDSLGLGRFREKYAAKIAATPDALRSGKDVVVLEPGQHWAGSWRLRRR